MGPSYLSTFLKRREIRFRADLWTLSYAESAGSFEQNVDIYEPNPTVNFACVCFVQACIYIYIYLTQCHSIILQVCHNHIQMMQTCAV